jgi:amino-acid N-acetyltransferase
VRLAVDGRLYMLNGMRSSEAIQSGPSLAGAVALLESGGLPISDLTEAHLVHFFHSGPAMAPSGLVGLEIYGAYALLRSLVVAPELRSTGLGSALVEHAESYAREVGVQSVFLLTATAERFFQRRGYGLGDRASAPAEIRGTREFVDICPASSAFMVKHLVS